MMHRQRVTPTLKPALVEHHSHTLAPQALLLPASVIFSGACERIAATAADLDILDINSDNEGVASV